jgi:hypothetical protein
MRQRSFISVLAVAALCLVPSLVFGDGGSVFGGLSTAQSYGQGKGTIGISAGLADANAIGGWFGYGMSKYTDCRVKLGVWDTGPNTRLALGGDFKWQFWSMAEGASRYPIDMAVGGFVEYDDFAGGSFFQIGSHLIGSYPIKLYKSGVLSPYGRLNVRLQRVSFDHADSNSDIKFGLNGGVAWEVTDAMRMYGEFQFDGNDGVFFGIEFGMM